MPKIKKRLWKTEKSSELTPKHAGKGDELSDQNSIAKETLDDEKGFHESEDKIVAENLPSHSSPSPDKKVIYSPKKDKKESRRKKSKKPSRISEDESQISKQDYIMINLKELDKLQQIFCNSKGDFLATTYKFKRPISEYKIRYLFMQQNQLVQFLFISISFYH